MIEALSQHLMLPDLWQHSAVNHLRAGSDVIVSAPTGAGKTFIFELFVKSSQRRGQAVYTVPTRALANDKYAGWKEAGWNIGLATGDLAVNVHAPVLVATLETQIERLLLGQGPDILVLDEFQMIADPARGSHYEAAIILAPRETRLLLLSGSVENAGDIADWMRRIGRPVEVVSTQERPVPLEETPVEVLPQRFRKLEGWWPRLAAAALMADLGPLLIFAPRRREAESIARKLAEGLPPGAPLPLTPEQRTVAGKEFAALLEKRIAFHHSGLPYAVRAGLVEPLAKSGQLRVIVSTMGLAAGINFSVRSVHVSSTSYHDGITEQQLAPDELLQMFGRAGRRGLDERGYVLTSGTSPSLSDARPARLRRSTRLSWPIFMRIMRRASLSGQEPFQAAREFASRLYARTPPALGLEEQPAGTVPAVPEAMFGLKGARQEIFNSNGQWEEARLKETAGLSLGECWRATAEFRGPALADAGYVQSLAGSLGRLCKLTRREGFQYYGREMALGRKKEPEGRGLVPTHSLRKLLGIPGSVAELRPEVVETKVLPRLAAHFPGGSLLGTLEKDGHLWARFDFSPLLVPAIQDSLGRWIVSPLKRTVERATETEIRLAATDPAQAARPGTPVHSWRALGLIESDGAPTRRGEIFSFFQHGEGLGIAAALEDESYPVDEMVLHLANLRSDLHFDMPVSGGSERLAAACRAAYGFVNHHGHLEAGLPLGYGEGTAELLGLLRDRPASVPGQDLAEGDVARARMEWLSLLRHITHAPAHEWRRWIELREAAGRILAGHTGHSSGSQFPRLPPLTPGQRHDRPKHFFMTG